MCGENLLNLLVPGVASPYYDYEEYGDYHYSAGPDPDQGDVASALNVAMSNIVRSIV